jgi:MHS family proline/betaine transporter-like MFS transporter
MLKKIKFALVVGAADACEWYDYALFFQFALLLSEKFFPAGDPEVSLMRAFLTFGAGYLMRTLGGIFFGIIGDKKGRKVALNYALLCMAIPTTAVGLLPTYDQVGALATVLMVLCRLVQGFSMGGAITGSVSLIIEHVRPERRGLAGSVPFAGICTGVLLGSFAAYITRRLFTAEQFQDWAWRLPFLASIAMLWVNYYIKSRVAETPQFLALNKAGKLDGSPLREVFKHHWFNVIVSSALNVIATVIFCIQVTYIPSFLTGIRGFDPSAVSSLSTTCYLVMASTCLLSGLIADKFGYVRVFFWNLTAIIALTPFAMATYQSGSLASIYIMHIALAFLSAMNPGSRIPLQARLFPVAVRNTAMSLSHNVANTIFGGSTPFLVALIVKKYGSIVACQWFVIACALLNVWGLWYCRASRMRPDESDTAGASTLGAGD